MSVSSIDMAVLAAKALFTLDLNSLGRQVERAPSRRNTSCPTSEAAASHGLTPRRSIMPGEKNVIARELACRIRYCMSGRD